MSGLLLLVGLAKAAGLDAFEPLQAEADLGLPFGAKFGWDIKHHNSVGVRAALGIAATRTAPGAGIFGVYTRFHLNPTGTSYLEPTVGMVLIQRGQGPLVGVILGHELLPRDGQQPALGLYGGLDFAFTHGDFLRDAWLFPEAGLSAAW